MKNTSLATSTNQKVKPLGTKLLVMWVLLTSLPATAERPIWGAQALQGQAQGQFSTDLIEVSSSMGLAVMQWTALTEFDSSDLSAGAEYWTRQLLANIAGMGWQDTVDFSSPSQANGVAVFNADYMDNCSFQSSQLEAAPGYQQGDLISPRIDLSGVNLGQLAIRFYSRYHGHGADELSLSVSTDDGQSWRSIADYRDFQMPSQSGFISLLLPAIAFDGVVDTSLFRLKFSFSGHCYFAVIDDVSLLDMDSIADRGFE